MSTAHPPTDFIIDDDAGIRATLQDLLKTEGLWKEPAVLVAIATHDAIPTDEVAYLAACAEHVRCRAAGSTSAAAYRHFV